MTSRDFTCLKKLVHEHQVREEQVLVPIVDKFLDRKASASMRREHKKISSTLYQLNRKLNRVKYSDETLSSFFKLLFTFNLAVREHFSREDNLIYWYAQFCLSHATPKVHSVKN